MSFLRTNSRASHAQGSSLAVSVLYWYEKYMSSKWIESQVIYKDIYASPARRANFGAVIPEKLICFSGGGDPLKPRMITESPERTCNNNLCW